MKFKLLYQLLTESPDTLIRLSQKYKRGDIVTFTYYNNIDKFKQDFSDILKTHNLIDIYKIEFPLCIYSVYNVNNYENNIYFNDSLYTKIQKYSSTHDSMIRHIYNQFDLRDISGIARNYGDYSGRYYKEASTISFWNYISDSKINSLISNIINCTKKHVIWSSNLNYEIAPLNFSNITSSHKEYEDNKITGVYNQ